MYQFDNILKPNVTQEKVYNTAAKDIVKGKTRLGYTMILYIDLPIRLTNKIHGIYY